MTILHIISKTFTICNAKNFKSKPEIVITWQMKCMKIGNMNASYVKRNDLFTCVLILGYKHEFSFCKQNIFG